MSFQIIDKNIRIDRETLLRLLLGCGTLNIPHDEGKIALTEITYRYCERIGENDTEEHHIDFEGNTSIPGLTHVEGYGTLMFKPETLDGFTLNLHIELHDEYE